MFSSRKINMGNLLESLSDAIDLADPQIARHQQRTAYLAWVLSAEMGVDEALATRIFTAALIHDLGAITVEEKVALHKYEDTDSRPHCLRGQALLRHSGIFGEIADLVRHHHTPLSEFDRPFSDPLVTGSQILMLADRVERMIDRGSYILLQLGSIRERVGELAPRDVHRSVVEAFDRVMANEGVWFRLISDRTYPELFRNGPLKSVEIDMDFAESVAKLVRDIIDFRSPFTATHSTGVSLAAELLARDIGFSESEARELKIAGLLHDLGKLVIPNSILEKPGSLTTDEVLLVKSHTFHTYATLRNIAGFERIAEWAGFHHERLDGSGYPFHLEAGELTLGAKVMMVADMFTALAESRPYRGGLQKPDVIAILEDFAGRELLDGQVVRLLVENFDRIHEETMVTERLIHEFYVGSFLNQDRIRDARFSVPASP